MKGEANLRVRMRWMRSCWMRSCLKRDSELRHPPIRVWRLYHMKFCMQGLVSLGPVPQRRDRAVQLCGLRVCIPAAAARTLSRTGLCHRLRRAPAVAGLSQNWSAAVRKSLGRDPDQAAGGRGGRRVLHHARARGVGRRERRKRRRERAAGGVWHQLRGGRALQGGWRGACASLENTVARSAMHPVQLTYVHGMSASTG